MCIRSWLVENIFSLLGAECLFCGLNVGSTCQACESCGFELSKLSNEAPRSQVFGGLRTVSIFRYEGWMRSLVLRNKRHCPRPVANWIAREIRSKMPSYWRDTSLAWVPGQAFEDAHLVESVAIELQKLGQPIVPYPLLRRRVGGGVAQKQLNFYGRRLRQIHSRFQKTKFRRADKEAKEILLFDDVITTGSTLKGLASLFLSDKNFEVIGGISIAFTPHLDSRQRAK